jgi:hypothetical protein
MRGLGKAPTRAAAPLIRATVAIKNDRGEELTSLGERTAISGVGFGISVAVDVIPPANVRQWVTRTSPSRLTESMKRIRYGDQSWMVGDSIATTMLEFTAVLAKLGSAENIEFTGIDENGHQVEVEFVLGPATMMTAERVDVEMSAPDNADREHAMRERIETLTGSPHPKDI